jgi:hypothetical protein
MSNKICKAEQLLGGMLFRQIQRRLPEGGKLTIPPKHRVRAEFHWPTPPKTERNAKICRAVLDGRMTKAEASRHFGVHRSRITVIVKEADRWLPTEPESEVQPGTL